MTKYALGMDLGGTNLRLRLHGPSDVMLNEQTHQLKGQQGDVVLSTIASLIEGVCRQHDVPLAGLPIGFAIAAMLDATGRRVVNAPNLKWKDTPLVDALLERLPARPQLTLLNDVDAAAYGEFVHGAGKGASQLACVLVGSGVGCGLVLNQQLYTGSSRVAAEFGHMKAGLSPLRPCGCGQTGCIEAYAGGHNIAKWLQEAAKAGESDFLAQRAKEKGLTALSPADLEQGQAAGDPTCIALGEQAAQALGTGLANLVTLLNPSHLLLGGSVLVHSPLLHQQVMSVLDKQSNPPAREPLVIASPQLGDQAGAIGAAAWARQLHKGTSD